MIPVGARVRATRTSEPRLLNATGTVSDLNFNKACSIRVLLDAKIPGWGFAVAWFQESSLDVFEDDNEALE